MKPCKPKIGARKIKEGKPVPLVSENPPRKALLVFNNGTATVELVDSPHAKYGDGIPIPKGTAYDNYHYCQGAYWIVVKEGDGDQDIRFEEDIERESKHA